MNFESLKSKNCLVLIGKAGAGKDTVADMIYDIKQSPRPRPFKFSYPLKKACETIFGWSAHSLGDMKYKEERLDAPLKTIDGRNLWTRREALQYIGTDVFRTMDSEVWINAALRAAAGQSNAFDCNGFICTDCRFPNELEALRNHFGEVRVVRLTKVGGEQTAHAGHASETQIDALKHDTGYSLEAGDLAGLKFVAETLSGFFPKEASDVR